MFKNTPVWATSAGLVFGMLACQGSIDVDQQEIPAATATPSPTPPDDGTLLLEPARIDFGPIVPGCQVLEKISVTNIGLTPVNISGVSLNFGENAFLVDDWRGQLDYQQSAEVMVAYRPNFEDEVFYGEVLVNSDAANTSNNRSELLGAVFLGAEILDTFTQSSADATDFLWVLDTSGSMSNHINDAVASFDEFTGGLINEGIDFQMGFTTMDTKNDVGQLLGTYGDDDIPFVTRSMGPDAVDDMVVTMSARAEGKSDDSERGLEAIDLALSPTNLAGPHAGFIREEAQLVVIVISDDDDYSSEKIRYYQDTLAAVKGDYENITFHAIVAIYDNDVDSESNPGGCADGMGTDYMDMNSYFGGQLESICANNYPGIMSTLGSYDRAILKEEFVLSTTPLSPEGMLVLVDEVQQTLGVEWTYDAQKNAIVFAEEYVPSAEAIIKVFYTDPESCE